MSVLSDLVRIVEKNKGRDGRDRMILTSPTHVTGFAIALVEQLARYPIVTREDRARLAGSPDALVAYATDENIEVEYVEI